LHANRIRVSSRQLPVTSCQGRQSPVASNQLLAGYWRLTTGNWKLETGYSFRIATIGSTAIARRAGM
jgi:hypothetical protein